MFLQVSVATEDLYPFQQASEQQRFQTLLKEVRCLVCQNQNLMDSEAPLAADLRMQVYRLMQEGKSDKEVLQYLTARYGDFVLYEPPLKLQTYFLWFAPIILFVIGSGFLFHLVRKKNK